MNTRSPRIFRKENKSINSYSPDVVRRIFLTISEIPWTGLIALSTIWGGFTLFMYFKSVDAWVVTDISTFLKITGGATVVSLVYLPVLGGILIYPGVLVGQFQDLNKCLKASNPISLDEVVFGMLSNISLFSLFSLYPFCEKSDSAEFVLFCVFLCICLFALASLVYSILGLVNVGVVLILARIFIFFALGFAFIIPFLIYVVLIEGSLGNLFLENGVWSELIPFGLGVLLLITFNCFVFLGHNISRGVIVSATFLIFYAEAALPLIFHKVSPFSVVTASVLEIRTNKPVKLIVPKSTCELVQSSIISVGERIIDLNNKSVLEGKECVKEMNFINAQVLSNVGESWRVKIIDVFDEVSLSHSGLTMSIPRKGIYYSNIKLEYK